MLVVLSSFLELVSIFTISTFADIYILNYESKPTLLVKIIQSVQGNPVIVEISVLCPP